MILLSITSINEGKAAGSLFTFDTEEQAIAFIKKDSPDWGGQEDISETGYAYVTENGFISYMLYKQKGYTISPLKLLSHR